MESRLGRGPQRAAYLEVEAGQYRVPQYDADKPEFGDMHVLVAAPPDRGQVWINETAF